MSRTTSAAVQALLGENYDGSTTLTGFIDTASAVVDRVDDLDTDGILSTTNLELIERWLSAHFYAQADPLYQSRSNGGASGSFQGQTAMVFSNTNYGQQAMALDFTMALSKMSQEAIEGGRRKAGFTWLGKNKVSQTDYEQRS